ncbi:hypothetical protein T484DRAFT_1796917, partial [Baffinella frigidus]
VLGVLLLCLIVYYCGRREAGPIGRPPAPVKAMVPVYLPQSYPVVPAEFTAAAPMPEWAPQYSGAMQPVMQQPYMVEQQPAQYVEQPQQQPWMVQHHPVAYGM